MPVSKKRKLENKEVEQKHVNPGDSKAGKILILILCLSMVIGLAVAAVIYMIQELGI